MTKELQRLCEKLAKFQEKEPYVIFDSIQQSEDRKMDTGKCPYAQSAFAFLQNIRPVLLNLKARVLSVTSKSINLSIYQSINQSINQSIRIDFDMLQQFTNSFQFTDRFNVHSHFNFITKRKEINIYQLIYTAGSI